MPGRKSNVSTTSNGADEAAETTPARAVKDGLSIEDLTLPRSMIGRLAKGVLPPNTQINKDALLALHKSATVFVSFIASNSNENAQASGKKTIQPQDVMAALKDAEYEDFLPRLESELRKYNDTQCDKRNSYRKRIKDEKSAAAGSSELETDGAAAATAAAPDTGNGHAEADDGERPSKKARGDDGTALPLDDGEPDDADDDDAPDGEYSEEDEVDEDEGGDEDDADETEGRPNDTLEDPLEDTEDRGESEDEALDEPDSD